MTFDEVLPTLLRVCETWPHAATLQQVAVVRDLRGLIRLAVDPTEGGAEHVPALGALLVAALGPWFTGEILSTRNGSTPLRGVAQKVLKQAPVWEAPRYTDVLGGEVPAAPGRWRLWERRVGKQPWLEDGAAEPWALDADQPAVVTFYSFKGGVGRTTTLAACALFAARAQEKVVVIDLDLEAPGLAAMFGAEVEQGVVDLLVDQVATGAVDLSRAVKRPEGLPAELADFIQVIPAGKLGPGYLEKLSRLDFAGSAMDPAGTQIPARDALLALLQRVRDELRPTWILLDARAGLHDLAGLSLHGLAHVDVLFSRSNRQGLAGLDLVLQVIAKRVRDAASRMVLVHAMAPAGFAEADGERAQMATATFKSFTRHGLYPDPARAPALEAEDADHRPWSIHRVERIERNDELDVVMPHLAAPDYRAVWERIRLLAPVSGGGGE
jgi:MinD-like ATPase involved in chromosome partitioning or flagellar assembly